MPERFKKSKAPNLREVRGFLRRLKLHCRNEVWKDDRGVLLKKDGHPGSHTAVDIGSAKGVDFDALGGLAQGVLGKGHQNAKANLHGVTAQRLQNHPGIMLRLA